MKKTENKKYDQVRSRVSVIIDELKLLRNMVEDLAMDRRTRTEFPEHGADEWRFVETSSLEAYASGDIYITIGDEKVRPVFTAPFLFTCVRKEGSPYKLSWKNSLN